jgi:hypothetical protein
MPVFDHPARVTVETGNAPGGVLAALAAVPALAVVAFAARYAVVLAVVAALTAVVTAALVRVLYRRWTVLSWRTRLQCSRADAPLAAAAVVTVHPAQITAPPARRALPAPTRTAPVFTQRPRTGIRSARRGA